MRKTALCLGAGEEQLPSIREAQALGLRVVAVDGNAAAPGLKIADEGQALDISMEEQVIAFARAQEVELALPVPLGRMLLTLGAVNDALRLPGLTRQAAENCTDKLLFHQKLQAASIYVPAQRCVKSADELRQAIREIGFPCLLKPRFGSGKKGVIVVSNHDGMETAIREHCRSWTRDGQSLVQELMAGQELGLDAVVIDKSVRVILVREKLLTPLPYRQEVQYLGPARLSEKLREELSETMQRAVQALALNNCLLHADVLLDPQGSYRIIEMAGRPSGLLITSLMTPAASGVKPLREFIRFQLGQRYDFSSPVMQPVVLNFLTCPPGKLQSIPEEKEVLQRPGVLAYRCRLQPGSRLRPITCSQDVLDRGYVLLTANTHEEALARMDAMLNLFRVSTEDT